jgi:hypothetical protein
MKKSIVAVLILVAVTLSSCGFTTTCPTYSKKQEKKVISKETRI